jgi:hypothetical protein
MTITCLAMPNVPAPPEQYIKESLTYLTRELTGSYPLPDAYRSRTVTKNGQTYQSRSQQRIQLDDVFTDWCQTNIDPKCYHCSICVTDGPGPYQGPHCDPLRDYGLLYITDPGGISVTTSFWHKEGSELVYPRDPRETYPFIRLDYGNDLKLVTQVVLEPNQWYLLNTRVIHSVENATSRRISLQCSLDDVADLLQKNNS